MGHLINPVAFRLGEFREWKDTWISTNNVAYTELLHNTMTLKEIVRHYITKPDKAFQRSNKISPLIFSHMSVEQTRVNKLLLKVYFYDTDVESSYRLLRMACKRIHRNQERLYRSFFRLHRWFVRSTGLAVNLDARRKAFYYFMSERGFFEYLILRKIIFLFLCAVFRDKFLKTHRGILLQIKVGLFSLLEYHWRKNLFYGKPLNFFEFFINVFLQMQFLERNISTNVIRATMFYFRKRFNSLDASGRRVVSFKEVKELLHLIKWFKFSRMSLISKLSGHPQKFQQYMSQASDDNDLKFFTKNQINRKQSYDKDYVQNFHEYKQWQQEQKWKAILWERKRIFLRRKKLKNKIRFQTWTPSPGIRRARLRMAYYYSSLLRYKQTPLLRVFSESKIRYQFIEKASFLYIHKMSKLFSWLSDTDLESSTRFVIAIRPHTFERFKVLLYNKSRTMQQKVWKYASSRSWMRPRRVDPVVDFYKKLASPESFFANESSVAVSTQQALQQMNTWTLFAYTYARYSYLLWATSRNQLMELFHNLYLKRSWRYKKFLHEWGSFSIWANKLFLDFYRIFFVRARYLYSFGFQKLLLESELNKVSMLPVTIDFFGFDNDLVTASFVAFYLSRKILQNFQIRDLFGPVSKDLRRIVRKTPYLLGYKLQFVGRLTRRDRLRTSWVMGGNLPLSTMSARVDYCQEFGILRNGMCSIRVWLYRPELYGDPNTQYLYKIVY